MKTIYINDKEYKLNSNVLTSITHKKIFNKDIFSDIDIIRAYLVNTVKQFDEAMQQKVISNKSEQEYIEAITRLTYSFVYNEEESKSYTDFLSEIGDIELYESWIVEVTELAVDTFC